MTRPVYCDESVWVPVADGLRGRGREVHTARGEGLLGEADRTQVAYARDRDWLLFTFDDDLLSLVEGKGEGEEIDHAGVVYADPRGKRVGDVVRSLVTALDVLRADWHGVHRL